MNDRKTTRPFIVRIDCRERTSFWRGTRWWSVQVAANGEVVYQSEMYTSEEKRDASAEAAANQLEVPITNAGSVF